MSGDHTLFVVDDIESYCLLLKSGLEPEYSVECFNTAEACLERMASQPPSLLLLDVDLPGISGFELCQKLRAAPATSRLPIIFISGLDDLDSRMEGYEAGGTDFVIKPFKLPELRKKIEVALQWSDAHQILTSQIADNELLTSLVLSNLDEYAALIGFLRQLNECYAAEDLIAPIFKLLAAYRLDGILQVRDGGQEKTLSANGENCPMEVTVINHVRGLERIFSFGSRTAYNFERITILVNNMPLHEEELCGRLRDHLAIAAETVDAKLASLAAFGQVRRTETEIRDLMTAVSATITALGEKYAWVHDQGETIAGQLQEKLMDAFMPLALSDWQEERIIAFVRAEVDRLIALYDFGDEQQQALESLRKRLVVLIVGD